MSDRIDIYLTNNPKADASMTGVRNITDLVDGQFSWTIDAQGGFATASLNIKCDEVTAFQFLNDYVGKRIVFTNPLAPDSSLICWEGLVYTVGVDDGKTTVSRSLENVYNSVKVTYAVIADGRIGAVTTSAATTNATSIAAYGTREVLWNMPGHALASSATDCRNMILTDYGTPRANLTAVRQGGSITRGEIRVSVDCVGFIETLSRRLPVHTFSGSFTAHKTIISTILTDYGEMINSDQTGMVADNSNGEFDGWTGKLQARNIIDALCSKGSTTGGGKRNYFGILENRKAYYIDEPSTASYVIRKYDNRETIVDATTGQIVPPWLVRPAKIIKVADLLPDELSYSTALGDPRQFLISSVKFVAPNLVALTPATTFPGSTRILALLGSTVLGYNFWGPGRS